MAYTPDLADEALHDVPATLEWPAIGRGPRVAPDRLAEDPARVLLQHRVGLVGAHRDHDRNRMSLNLYDGELTISPIPVELSLNFCSHSCHFCFANLNAPNRRADVPSIMRLLAEHETRKSPVAHLLRGGYPVLFSNRVDPFANSNYQQAVPIIETMTELGIPIAFQTRGGRGIDDVLRFLPVSCWYVSISQIDDEIRKRQEPGAPPIESRFELIQQLVEAGHRVVLGCNPYVSEWLPDPEPLFARAKACGAEGVWIDPLHFNRDQIQQISARGKTALGKNLIATAMLRRPDAMYQADLDNARSLARDVGLEVYSIGEHERTDFWRPYFETYPNLFPITQTLVNACWDHLADRSLIKFSTWAKFMGDLPAGMPGVDTYIRARAKGGRLMPALVQSGDLDKLDTFHDVLRLMWREPRISLSPGRLKCFAYPCRKESDGSLTPWADDEDGLPLMMFDRAGFTEYCVEYSEREAAEAA